MLIRLAASWRSKCEPLEWRLADTRQGATAIDMPPSCIATGDFAMTGYIVRRGVVRETAYPATRRHEHSALSG